MNYEKARQLRYNKAMMRIINAALREHPTEDTPVVTGNRPSADAVSRCPLLARRMHFDDLDAQFPERSLWEVYRA